jgi:dihydroflavonol-4-reductase
VRWLVTGGTGFIGANLVRHLVARGEQVRCLVRKPNEALAGLPVELVSAPLAEGGDGEALARAVDGCAGVYHLAGAFDPSPGGIARMQEVHVGATRALMRACEQAGVPRLLVCSSSITVGWGPRSAPGAEDTPLDPSVYGPVGGALRAYHDSKAEAERLMVGWRGGAGLIVNPDYIVGAWDVKPTSGQLILTMGLRPVPFYPRGGKCFMEAEACAEGHRLAMERGAPGRRYLLGTENASYREFMGIIAEVTGQRAPLFPLPGLAVRGAAFVAPRLAAVDPHRFAGLDPWVLRSMQQERYRDGARARDELGVAAPPLRLAVERAWRWFVDHGRVPGRRRAG